MSEWTKGPWHVRRLSGNWEEVDFLPEGTLASVQVFRSGVAGTREENSSNAHLIAAAPELYEALKAAVLILENHPGVSVDTQGMKWALAKPRKANEQDHR